MRCLFCRLPLPAGAKFCSACGNPSHFGPCDQCDAVNPREAPRCWRCDSFLAVAPALASGLVPAYGEPVSASPPDPVALPVLAVRQQHALTLLPTPQRSISWQRMALPAALVALVAGVGLSALDRADDVPEATSAVPLAATVPAAAGDPVALPQGMASGAQQAPTPVPEPAPAAARNEASDGLAAAPRPDAKSGAPADASATGARRGPPGTRTAATGRAASRSPSRASTGAAERMVPDRLEPARLPALVQANGAALSQPRERAAPASPATVDASARCVEHIATLGACDLRSLPKGN